MNTNGDGANGPERLVALTFDLDLVDYMTGEPSLADLDATSSIADLLDARGWPATWFLRLDEATGVVFGDPSFMFERHGRVVDRLRERGDEIAWHPHPTRRRSGRWTPEVEIPSIVAEIAAYAPLARRRSLQAVRMGHGFHTNETMRAVASAGFAIDSSAIPRPMYAWDDPPKDWTGTPLMPYRPAMADYRIPGEPSLAIAEIPISVAHVPSSTDTQHVMRYVNPAYRHEALAPALQSWFGVYDLLVTITHPCELLQHRLGHPLITGRLEEFARNLDAIECHAARSGAAPAFVTVSEFAERTIGPASVGQAR
jgi:hypothetical protein